MTPLLDLTLFFVVWTFAVVVAAAVIRNKEWTSEGRSLALGNRDVLPKPTNVGGRAIRAANNSIEAAIFFVPLALIAHLVGKDSEVFLGAQIAFYARIIYVVIYLVGVPYVRSLVWFIGVIGLGLMLVPLL